MDATTLCWILGAICIVLLVSHYLLYHVYTGVCDNARDWRKKALSETDRAARLHTEMRTLQQRLEGQGHAEN